LSRHIASECTSKALCWNFREPGHTANNCSNEGLCHSCGKAGHRARDCPNTEFVPGDLRLCNNCLKPGHFAAEYTNGMACKNCRKTGHIARDCTNDPVCNSCNAAGHVARNCQKGGFIGERGGGGPVPTVVVIGIWFVGIVISLITRGGIAWRWLSAKIVVI
ncbi:cellular nucleic acid-binding protein homolog, partial [Phtheirospermum japonicum]